MERAKVKHSNNGDSCFSLFEKIHFVLLSAPSSSPRPALISSHCLLLPGMIRDSEWERESEREREREKGRWAGEEKSSWSQWTSCGRMWQEYHSSPTHPWVLSTPKWFNTELQMREVIQRQSFQSSQAALWLDCHSFGRREQRIQALWGPTQSCLN